MQFSEVLFFSSYEFQSKNVDFWNINPVYFHQNSTISNPTQRLENAKKGSRIWWKVPNPIDSFGVYTDKILITIEDFFVLLHIKFVRFFDILFMYVHIKSW